MKNSSKIILQIALVIMMVFSFSGVVNAQLNQPYNVLAPLPGVGDNETRTTTFSAYLGNSLNLAIGIAAVMAFVMITFGGIMYATSDAISGKQQGREYIENALWGLLLIIGAYVILYTINPRILDFNLDPATPVTSTSTSTTIGVPSGGLQSVTVNAIAGLRNECLRFQCRVFITSTTGDSHDPNSLHYQGLAVDIRQDSARGINRYLTNQSNNPPACAVFTRTISGVNTRFLWEPRGSTCGGAVPSTGDHWHMSVTP